MREFLSGFLQAVPVAQVTRSSTLLNAADLEFSLLLRFLVEPTLYLSTGDRMPSFVIAASIACFNSYPDHFLITANSWAIMLGST